MKIHRAGLEVCRAYRQFDGQRKFNRPTAGLRIILSAVMTEGHIVNFLGGRRWF
jgi:hypothetical protein